MSIIKSLTNKDGIVYEYHKIIYIIIDDNDNIVASIASWINKDRATEENKPVNTFSFRIHTPITAGMIASAEALLISDPDNPLYGGIIKSDVVLSDLDTAKAKKRIDIESAKNLEVYAPKATSFGIFDNTDVDNNKLSIVIQVTQLAQAHGAPAIAGFKDTTGTWSEYTLTQLETIALEMAAQVIPLYTKESALVAHVDAATTIDEINAVVW